MITVRLTADTLEGLEARIDQYLRDYHPAGYGTSLKSKGYTMIHQVYPRHSVEVQWYAEIIRGTSCD